MSKICPLIQKECIQHQCEWWIMLLGTNPQTGAPTDEWGCTVRWLPILLTENASMIRKAAGSTDKVATEVARHHGTFLAAMPQEMRDRVMAANPSLAPVPRPAEIGNGDGKNS